MNYGSLEPHHIDLLKEICNIGAGHAATALSTLLSRRIDMQVPHVKVVTFEEGMNLMGGSEQVVSSSFLRFEGDVSGGMFFLLSIEDATTFVQELLQDQKITFQQFPYNEMALSALKEMGNILAGSYLSSFSDFTKLRLSQSVPSISIDMVGAILSNGLLQASYEGDMAIMIDTVLTDGDKNNVHELNGHFLLIPDPESIPKIFSSLGVQ
ncbi:chemotaxis protein CheC [Priestia koreensis]|uniref:Chemotaxis protein CheY n=1 Tax=Priestia koreensis TaxID=284581 RepID=A0A0M0L742_9BACI|nr:chemotaxis protein CheC [Priestia koreensis]KOO46697.1 chemotaxis protein CheY [Priestia koreensis]